MAINFESPQAFDSRVAEAYGASQARQADREFALKANSMAAESSYRAAALQQADEHFRDSQQLQANTANAHMQSQQNMQQQHGDLQMQLQETSLNQAEQMRAQRLERQVEYLTANSGDGKAYTMDEGRDMITQLRTGLDPLQERNRRAMVMQTQLENQKIQHGNAQQASIVNANANFDANNTAGTVRHFQDQSTGEDLGPHQWDRQKAQWMPMRLGTAGGSGGSRPAPITASTAFQSLTHNRSSADSATGQPAATPTADQIVAHAQTLQEADTRIADLATEQARLRPRGQLPFDPLPPNTDTAKLPYTEKFQQDLNQSIRTADQTGQMDRSQVLRRIGVDLRRPGMTTGQLTPEQQQTLQGMNYYHGDFTQALDRELGRIENPPRQSLGTLESGSAVTMHGVTQAQLQATRGIRNLMGRYGTMENMAATSPVDYQAMQNHLAAIRVFQWGGNTVPHKPDNQAESVRPSRPRPRADLQQYAGGFEI